MSIWARMTAFFRKKEKNETSPKTYTDFLKIKDVYVTAMENNLRPALNGKIVVFEDSETWSLVLKKALEKEGYTVKIYPSADDPAMKIKLDRPDLVLMDVNMPGMTGYTAAKMIKARVENKDLPIIILTSQNTPQDRMEAMKSGARSFLTKDQPLEDLIFAINAYMTNTALKSDISSLLKIKKEMSDQGLR